MRRWPVVLLLATALSTPLLAQSISAELPVSVPQLTGTADYEQVNPAVATDGEIFLAAWQNRAARSEEIYATRISRDGALLDQTPIPIAIPPRRGERPQVVWTGELFVVLWLKEGEVRATKISRDGQIVGEESLGFGFEASASCTATRCLVTWPVAVGSGGLYRLLGRVLDSRGTPLVQAFELARFVGAGVSPLRSATNGSNFLVTWLQFNFAPSLGVDLYTSAVSLDGVVSNVQKTVSSDRSLKQPAVASDGSGYFLAWPFAANPTNRIDGQQLDSSGRLSGTPKILDASGAVGESVSLVRISQGYLVVMSRRSGPEGLFAFRVKADGAVLDSEPALLTDRLPSSDSRFAAAGSGSKVMVVWPKALFSSTQPDIVAAVVDSESLAVQESFVVSRGAAPQRSPALATDGHAVVTVWSEASPAPAQLRVATFSPGGSRSDARAVHPSTADQVHPVVAFNGNEYLVAWNETPHNASTGYVMTKRLNRSGEPIDASEIVLSSGACANSNVAAASDGRDFVVAWPDCLAASRRLFATHISSGVAGESRLIRENRDYLEVGQIAWGGEQYLLTWLTAYPGLGVCGPGYCSRTQVEGMRLGRAMEILDVGPRQLSAPYQAGLPRVVWDGARFAVFWIDFAIYVARVSPSGAVDSPAVLDLGLAYFADRASLAADFDGSAIAITWAEGLPGSPFRDIWMAWVRFGAVPTWSAFRVTDSADDELATDVTAIGPGAFAVAYQRAAHERELGSANRVFVRTVEFPPRRRATGR